MEHKIHLLTLGWNNLQYSQGLLATMLQHVNLPVTVIFVDNGSTDATPTEIPKLLKHMQDTKSNFTCVYHREPENLNFAGGFNVALRISKELDSDPEKFLALINNDTEFSPMLLENLLIAYNKAPLGEDSNHALTADQKMGVIFPTTNFTANTGQKRLTPTSPLHPAFGETKYKYIQDGNCPWLFVFAKQKVFDDIGSLDTNFKNSFEDGDMNERLRRSNYVSYIDSTSWLLHHGSRSVWLKSSYVKDFEDSHNFFNLKHWNIPIPNK